MSRDISVSAVNRLRVGRSTKWDSIPGEDQSFITSQKFAGGYCCSPHSHRVLRLFGGLEVVCWPLEPKFRGFKPGRSSRIFQGEKKILSTPSFGSEVKPSVPCRRFTACKRSPECYVEVGHLQAKFIGHFSSTYLPPLAARFY
jgi:hypothetical protein